MNAHVQCTFIIQLHICMVICHILNINIDAIFSLIFEKIQLYFHHNFEVFHSIDTTL